jgi:cation diffusion facilitator family transporter
MAIDHAGRLRAARLSIGASLLVFSTKALAFVATGSAAIFSDAAESVVNVVAASFLIWSLLIAARPADVDHPYGHGKVEFFTAGLEGALIVVAALMIAIQAARSLVAGTVPQQLDLGLMLLVGASAVNGGLGVYLVRAGRRTGSLALEADGRHVLADVWTSVGVVVGLALVAATGWAVLDPLIALAVAAWVLREGFSLTRRSVDRLMDAADTELLTSLTRELEVDRAPEWIDAHGLRAWRSGAELHVDLHLVVPRYFTALQLHDIHDHVERLALIVEHGEGDVVVHFDPCRPDHCPGCPVAECPVRGAEFAARLPLSVESATRPNPEID